MALGRRRRGAEDDRSTARARRFPYPIYSKWFSEYDKLHPNVQINYQSIGSGGGIRQVHEPDGVLRRHRRADDQRPARWPRPARILHFPTVLGAVVPIYNMPGVTPS